MAEVERQRLSFWGVVSILMIGVVIYFFMQGGHLFLLYALATVVLCVLLVLIAFDIGIKKKSP